MNLNCNEDELYFKDKNRLFYVNIPTNNKRKSYQEIRKKLSLEEEFTVK